MDSDRKNLSDLKVAVIGMYPENFFNPIAGEIKKNGTSIDLISLSNDSIIDMDGSYNNVYKGLTKSMTLSKIGKIIPGLFRRKFWSYFFSKSSLSDKVKMLFYLQFFPSFEQYDIINVQYNVIPHPILKLFPKHAKLIASFWGSDIYRLKGKYLEKQKELIDRANVVTVHHEEMKELFDQKYPNFEGEVVQCLIPLEPELFGHIDKEKSTPDKIGVSIGYNTNPSFRHIELINLISNLDEEIKDKIRIIVFTTYGGSEKYTEEVNDALVNSGCDYIVYKDKCSLPELAKRRKDMNILLHIPMSDAFSGTVSEVLYSGNLVIAGSWLPYSSYEKQGVYFEKVNDLEEVENVLIGAIENFDEVKKKCEENPQKVIDTLDYSGNMDKWTSLFKI